MQSHDKFLLINDFLETMTAVFVMVNLLLNEQKKKTEIYLFKPNIYSFHIPISVLYRNNVFE